MKTETRQRLFDYFAQEHGISLLDSDFNELEAIVNDRIPAAAVEAENCKVVIKAKIWRSIETGNSLTTDCKMLSDLDYYSEQPAYVLENCVPFDIEITLPTPYQPKQEG